MKLDIYQCNTCYYTDHQPAGQTSIFLDRCPRCAAGVMEKTGTGISSQEYDENTRKKMNDLKNKIWKF